mmetsp:Transcript_32887/g.79561  ORF Transcript_32887/g.79561 Transcript_32887/m.79561 type:complete len:346 (+) Transcript_32887:49-1086(+)
MLPSSIAKNASSSLKLVNESWKRVLTSRKHLSRSVPVFGILALCITSIVSSNNRFSWCQQNSLSSSRQKQDDMMIPCSQRLQKVEEQYNKRRQARMEAAASTNVHNLTKQTQFDPFEPDAVCFTEERFGSDSEQRYDAFGDGPKFICGADVITNKNLEAKRRNEKPCLVYSIGSNNDIQFEKSVHGFLGCETHTFDPTLKEEFKGKEYATFHPWGIGKDGATVKFRKSHTWTAKSIESVMNTLGHMDRTIDILKIDCERCEYDAMPPFFDLVAAGKIRVHQIQIEVHVTELPSVIELFQAADRAKMRIFHKERNGWGCMGWRCVEYSFISESFLREANRAAVCGT